MKYAFACLTSSTFSRANGPKNAATAPAHVSGVVAATRKNTPTPPNEANPVLNAHTTSRKYPGSRS